MCGWTRSGDGSLVRMGVLLVVLLVYGEVGGGIPAVFLSSGTVRWGALGDQIKVAS